MNRAGAETMVMNLYRALDKTQYQFDFVYFTDDACDFDEEILALGGKIYRLPLSNFVSRTVAMYRFLKANKQFYAIHSHMFLNIGFDFAAAYLAGHRNLIAHSHSTSNHVETNFIQKIYYHLSRILINIFTKTAIACGKEAGDFLFYKSKKVLVMPNAIDFKLFNNSNLSNVLRNKLKITNDTLLICQIGRFQPVKNHEFTLRLAHFMKKQQLDFHFVFVGNGLLEQQTIKLAHELQVTNAVTFLGLRADIPEILSQADVMIMPSFHEGFPVVLVESQVAGTPALISDTIANEVDLGVNLVVFESLNSDLKLWSDKLFELKSQKKINHTSHHGVLKQKGFDITDNAKKLIEIYNQ
jgi:glycosyltransferase EpsF